MMEGYTILSLLLCLSVASASGAQSAVVRLAGGSSVNEGRVEVYANGNWGTVCDDLWGMADGNVVCRQLGFPGVSSVKVKAHFGRGTVPILLDNVNCDGDETSILDCAQNRIGVHNCGHHEDAGVICNKAIRLAGARKNVELGWGIVEFYRDGQWGTVCGIGFSREDTNVACGQLGYPTPSFYYFEYDELKFFGAGTGAISLTGVTCQGDEASLMDCELSSTAKATCTHAVDAEVVCKEASARAKREGEDIESIHRIQEQIAAAAVSDAQEEKKDALQADLTMAAEEESNNKKEADLKTKDVLQALSDLLAELKDK